MDERAFFFGLEDVLHPALRPVAGQRDLPAFQSALLEEDLAQRLHVTALAVRKDIHGPAGPVRIRDRLDQHVAGPCGDAVARQPGDIQPCGSGNRLDVGLGPDLQESHPRSFRRQCLDACGDGRERCLVAGKEVPVRFRVGVVGAAGTREGEGVARLCPGRPRARQAFVAVDHEVNGQFLRLRVNPAQGVGAGERPLVTGHGFPDFPQIQGRGVLDAGLGEDNLYVPVHEPVVGEVPEAVPACHDPDHVRRQLFLAQDSQVDLRAALLGCAGGGGNGAHKASLS